MCSIHYRKISLIVREVAAEHNVPYLTKPTFGSALASHVRFLKKMGREPNYGLA